ncbi:hypothetical protein MSG28_013952 [Choristoneura fumiferana]|uniref:Uncharacterized protein n=1 Tax=Choristoneura fumiferana TaxID=7141 RepID=A0ACC0K9G4_CHOFU|nr:hypothetical protein MSG28_013952 [Choristoneura fumiferana]
MFEKRLWILIMLCLVVLTAARPQEFDDDDDSSNAGDRKADDVARVQIKVYRGPTKHDGYAPWGFWVKQPSDE